MASIFVPSSLAFGQPANDNPCTATNLTVNTSCVTVLATSVNATNTAGVPAPTCGIYINRDVWFTVTVPASGFVAFNSTTGTMTDGAMAIYTAPSCAGPFTEIACNDDQPGSNMPGLSLSGLTPGTVLYVRFWRWFGGSGQTFNICAYSPAMPSTDCVYMLELFDSNGNGWGASSVGISINGGAFTNYTVTGSYNVIFIGLNIGDVLAVQYNNGGPNQGQNSYELTWLGNGMIVFASGTPPGAGIIFTQTVDCVPPVAPPEDCLGAITVCSNGAFNNNTSNTGNVADLSASNYGCLLNAERQGTWYTFSPSVGGNVAFSINPTNPADDYDFAIWGPFPPGSNTGTMCPPPGAPARCSYSALTGNTGLNYTATDDSEGAGGDKWVNDLTVTMGEVYLLYISNWSQSGLAFNLGWNLTNGASLDCTVLPIELLSLEAVPVSTAIEVRWRTASEVDNDRFEVERSHDGEQFTLAGVVDGAGTSGQETWYVMTDEDARHGLNYYRLKQVDTDGHHEYSPVVSAFLHAGGDAMLFPSPGSDEVHMVLSDGIDQAMLRVLDATGRIVITRPLSTGYNTIDTRHLPRAPYGYRVDDARGAVLARGTWLKH